MKTALKERNLSLDLFEDSTEGKVYLKHAREIALALYEKYKTPLSVNDVRKKFPPSASLMAPPGNGRIMGAVFRSGWRKVGYTKSDRVVCHGRDVALFVPRDAKPEDYLQKMEVAGAI